MITESQGHEWVETREGHAVILPHTTSPEAVRWAQLLVGLIAPHVHQFTNIIGETEWSWDGDDALIERVVQAIMNEQANRALLSVERAVVKELR
jgi:hypothetical protein